MGEKEKKTGIFVFVFAANIIKKYSYASAQLCLCTKNNTILAKNYETIAKNGKKL